MASFTSGQLAMFAKMFGQSPAPSTISLALAPAEVLEDGTTNLVYTFTRTGDLSSPLTVNYTVGGTAASGTDYTGISTTGTTATVSFAAGSATATVTVDPSADSTVELDETVALTLAAGTGYTIGTTGTVTGTISNDDVAPLPSITLALAPATVAENGTANLVYTFTRTGDLTSQLNVNYTVGGTATNGTDYTGISTTGTTKTVSFAAGSATVSVTVDPTADSTVELDETVALTLAAGTGYTIGTTGAVNGTITNEGVSSSTFGLFDDKIGPTAFKSGAIDSSSYELGTKFVSSQNGSISALKYYRGAADADDTDARTLRLWRGNGTLLGTVTITSPPGAIGWQVGTLASPIDIAAGETYVVSYGYVFNNNSGALESYAITENYFVAASTSPSGTLTAPFSSTSGGAGVYSTSPGSIPTQTWNASNYWVDVAFSTSSTPSLPSITLAAPATSVAEDGTANLVYTFTRSGSTSSLLSVNYTVGGSATNGSDYTGIAATGTTKTISFATGSSTASLTVSPIADTIVEPDETVLLTLATGSGYTISTTGAVTGTIKNDDFALDVTLPPSGLTTGWTVNEKTVGLAPFGIIGEDLPVYTGPYMIPAGSYISGVRFTQPVNLHQGNITIEKSLFQPTSSNGAGNLTTTTDWSDATNSSARGKVVIRDSEFDGTLLSDRNAAFSFGFTGIADLQRNYIHGLGIGIALMNTGTQYDSIIEHNYVTDTPGWGNAATDGNHVDAFTIRDFTDAVRPDRKAIIRNNRFDANAPYNTTGALFIQSWAGRIDNLQIEGNLLEGGGYNLILETKGYGYSNVSAINNRFVPEGWGATYNSGGEGWATWQGNYRYDPTIPGGMGTQVFQ
jgi:hypothetical protein